MNMKMSESKDLLIKTLTYMHMRSFTAILQKEENMYVALCPEVGTTSQGKTVDEAVKNLKEATELYLDEFPMGKKGKSLLTTFEVA